MMAGYVTLILRDAKTGLIERQLGPFRNLITDAALNYIGNGAINTAGFNGYTTNFFLGASTDATAPTTADTALAGEITPTSTQRTTDRTGTPASAITYVAGSPDYFSWKHSRTFSTAQANGVLTKLGLFTAATGGTMLAATLIRDASSNPTTLTKTNTQTLTVLWEFRWYLPAADTVTTPTIGGVATTVTARAANVNNGNNGWGGPIMGNTAFPDIFGIAFGSIASYVTPISALVLRTAAPTLVAGHTLTIAALAYTAGNFFRDVTFKDTTAAVAALSIQDNRLTALGSWLQVGFSPSLAIGQQITLRLSWGRFP